MSGLIFRPFRAADAIALPLQLSQHISAGLLTREMSEAEALALERGGPAWTVEAGDGRLLCCAGFYETFTDPVLNLPVQANAWAMLATGIGTAHLAITRYARQRFTDAPYARIEAIVRDGAECAWARLVGMQPGHILRSWGAASEDHILMERVRP